MARTKQPIVDGKKLCIHCNETKPADEFYKIRQRGFEYHDSKCDSCRKKYNAKYAGKWYREHKDSHQAQMRKWRTKNREHHDFLMWRSHVKRKYGLSTEQVHNLFSDPRCQICGAVQTDKGQRLCVDHCHKSGMVRGLLCNACNQAVSRIDAIPDWCELAEAYLKTHGYLNVKPSANTQRA